MSEDEEANELIEFLVDMGVLRPLGYTDGDGQEMYMVTEKAEKIFPELPEMQERETNSAVFELWQIDMLDVRFDDNGDPLIALNKNSTNPEKVEMIEDESLRRQMYMILAAFLEHFDGNNR